MGFPRLEQCTGRYGGRGAKRERTLLIHAHTDRHKHIASYKQQSDPPSHLHHPVTSHGGSPGPASESPRAPPVRACGRLLSAAPEEPHPPGRAGRTGSLKAPSQQVPRLETAWNKAEHPPSGAQPDEWQRKYRGAPLCTPATAKHGHDQRLGQGSRS